MGHFHGLSRAEIPGAVRCDQGSSLVVEKLTLEKTEENQHLVLHPTDRKWVIILVINMG